jgi:hypothetical protein
MGTVGFTRNERNGNIIWDDEHFMYFSLLEE